jgi:hypothetical protein
MQRHHRSKLSGRAAFLSLAVVFLAVKLFVYIWRQSVNVFYFDQWDTLQPFFEGDTNLLHLFTRQFSVHRLGLGLISLRFLYGPTHWSARAESFLIGGCIFLAMLLAMLLKRRLFGRLSWTDVAIPLVFLTLEQNETLIGATNPAFGGMPLLLVICYCLCLSIPNQFRRYGLILAADVLLVYTGYGFFMGILTPAILGLDAWRFRKDGTGSLRLVLAGIILSGAILGSFFIHYTFTPNADCFEFPHGNFVAYPWFVALMISAFLGLRRPIALVTAAGLAGLAIVIAAFAIQLWRVCARRLERSRSERTGDLVIAVLLGYSLLYAGSAAVGRACLGLPDAAQVPRYSTLLIPAFLGLYFFLLTLPAGRLPRFALVSFLLVVLPGGLAIPNSSARKLRDGKVAWARCYLRTGDLGLCDQTTGFPLYPDPQRNGMREKLAYLRAHHLSFFYSLE